MNIWATDAQQTLAEQTTVKYFKGRVRRKANQLPPQTQNSPTEAQHVKIILKCMLLLEPRCI